MTLTHKLLVFFVLPILALFLYPPQMLMSGLAVVGVTSLFLIGLGILLMRGLNHALTFAIFLQGMNIIIRIMMFFTNGISAEGQPHWIYIITSLLAMALSFWLVNHLDQPRTRTAMLR